MICVGLVLALETSACWAQDGLREVKVSAPTRLDWKFAVKGFGPKAARLPESFDSARQRYQLYVPKNYRSNKDWPLVVFISPGDRPMGWNAWKKICSSGVLFCSPYGAGNSCPTGQRTRIVLDMLDDIRRNYRIDPDQTYLTGFSGGGRMACAIGLALPEWFGGIIPVCGTNPLPAHTYLRHRATDRLSLSFVTGEKDFNRAENEVYMYPWFQELNIRSKLWVVPGLGHDVPSASVMAEVYAWLEADLSRRRADVKARPRLAMTASETPTPVQQAQRCLEAAEAELKQADRVWRGVALLQGIIARWNDVEPAAQAKRRLKAILDEAKLLEIIAEQGADDEQRSLSAQAKALERFGDRERAVKAWEILAGKYPDTSVGKHAAGQVRRLRDGTSDSLPPAYLGLGLADKGLAIDQLAPGGPAEKAGLKVGDVLLKLDAKAIAAPTDLVRIMKTHKPGDRIRVEVRRGDRVLAITLIAGARPK
jgi:hypothetical protein